MFEQAKKINSSEPSNTERLPRWRSFLGKIQRNLKNCILL
jgi:hypothetical protein